MRRYHRLRGFPPEHPPTGEGRKGETMDQPVTVDPHVEGIPVIESGEEYSSFESPSTPTSKVVKQPSSRDSTFQFPVEGYSGAQYWVFSQPSDDPVASKFGSIAPFWYTSIGQTVSEYVTTTFSYVMPQTTWDTRVLSNDECF